MMNAVRDGPTTREASACPHCGRPATGQVPHREVLMQVRGEAKAILGRIDKLLEMYQPPR